VKGLGRVLIVGGGIGGMAAAIALRKNGVEVDLVEVDPEWRVYGSGITITGPTLRAYRDLGLLDAIGEHGFLSTGQKMFLFDGTPLAELDQFPIEPGLPAAGGIMRPKLHQIMSGEVRKLGTNVRLGVTVDSIEDAGDEVRVRFSDGTEDAYSLVIGADGMFSKIRSLMFPDAVEPEYTGQVAWRVVAKRPPEMDKAEFFFGHSNVGGIIPCSQTEVYAFVLQPKPTAERIDEAEQPQAMREAMAAFGGRLGEIRDGIGPDSSVVRRPFEYAFQPKPWHIGRVVLIGDAVHATTAHLASGAGIAVEDALILAEEVRRDGDVEEALERFTERRFERCKFVVESSVNICRRQLAGAPADEIGMLMGKAMHVLGQPI
jgi:2-polyprenyl-6-methoxyphenol hydroxylase-like FAD-dependent oxidoreductase